MYNHNISIYMLLFPLFHPILKQIILIWRLLFKLSLIFLKLMLKFLIFQMEEVQRHLGKNPLFVNNFKLILNKQI